MRAVVQRVRAARVSVDGNELAAIGVGLCILLGVAQEDDEDAARRLAPRCARLRVFPNEAGRFDRSLLDVGGEALVVSQFTLIADTRRQTGTRPDLSKAARPDVAEPLYQLFCEELRELGVVVHTGHFGARMLVEIKNDGPVTLVLDT